MITLGMFCCVNKKTEIYTLKGICEKIIIQDSTGSKTIHFLISFHNQSNKEIMIYSNSFNKKANKNGKYVDAGIFLKGLNVNTPIGQFHTANTFYINSGKSLKLLYSYGDQYPNQKIDFTNLDKELKKVTLYYHVNKHVTNVAFKNNMFNAEVITKDFEIDMTQVLIEYNKNLNVEDAIKLTDGKINR